MGGFRKSLTPEQLAERRAAPPSVELQRFLNRPDPADVIPPGGNFYDTGRWSWLRNKTIFKYGNRCMRCKTDGDNTNPIQVDHIKPRSKYPELECDLNNLQVLCKNCNHEKSNTDETDYRT